VRKNSHVISALGWTASMVIIAVIWSGVIAAVG
jgi:hypothetical protein